MTTGLGHAEDAGDALPGGVALALQPTEVGSGDGERAVVEELAYGLDRLADIAAELGGGVAEDMDARGRETGQAEVATEAVVEGSAGDAGGSCAGLPERLLRLHGGEVLAEIGERPTDGGQSRTGELTAATHAALADISIERAASSKAISPAERLMTSDLRLPVSTRVNTIARSLLPLTLSGTTWRSCCIWDAERPLGAPGRGLGARRDRRDWR